jgi:predicted nucleic acid-binding protein
MAALLDADVLLVEPAILPVEVGGALHRAGTDAESAREYAESLFEQPYVTLVATDERMARRSLAMAIQCRLRGADALYVAAAAQYGARLVTLDAEQLDRAPASVRACKPDAATRLLKRMAKETGK